MLQTIWRARPWRRGQRKRRCLLSQGHQSINFGFIKVWTLTKVFLEIRFFKKISVTINNRMDKSCPVPGKGNLSMGHTKGRLWNHTKKSSVGDPTCWTKRRKGRWSPASMSMEGRDPTTSQYSKYRSNNSATTHNTPSIPRCAHYISNVLPPRQINYKYGNLFKRQLAGMWLVSN